MKQDYEFSPLEEPSAWATTSDYDVAGQRPSDQAVRNILMFARSYQSVKVQKMKLRFYLN